MSTLPDIPDFYHFYHAVNKRAPFPWESRLADRVKSGYWPALVGVPTGLGKNSCVDIAVWSLAAQAHLRPAQRTAPTRLWWVVNRRLLVDDTYRHVKQLVARLNDRSDPVLASVADRLRSYNGSTPLEAIRLRGGVPTGRPSSATQPAVISATIPIYRSRVLFRGYGTYRYTRPIDASLASTDSLVICDEAHLAPYLSDMLEQLADLDNRTRRQIVLPAGRHRPKVVAVTATGGGSLRAFVYQRP